MAARLEGKRRQARLEKAFRWDALQSAHKPLGRMTLSMTPGPGDRCFVSGIACSKLWILGRKKLFTSSRASICGRGDRSIRKKVIGHGMSIFGERFAGGSVFHRLWRALPLLHQPARQHGRGVFFQPGVEQLSDLLAEIGGVAQARKLVTLQRIARSRVQELPRRLGFVIQGDLQGKRLHSKRIVNTVNGTYVHVHYGKVCKSRAWDFAPKSCKHSGLEAR